MQLPRFYFTVREGSTVVPDLVGSEHADLDEALFEARMTARDLVIDRLKASDEIDGREIDVTDVDGKVLRILKVRDVMKY